MSSSQSPTRNKAVALKRARPTTARGPRYGILMSALFHGAIVAAALVTLQRNFDTPDESHAVPVDLVTIADKTNVAAMAPPAPIEKLVIPPPTPDVPPEPVMREAEPAPVPPIPKFKVEKEKPTDDSDKPKSKKEQADDFAALLNKLTASEKQVKNAKAGPRIVQAVGAGSLMTADLMTALENMVYRCYSPPIGVPNPNDLVVTYSFMLNRDGTVARVQLLTLNGNSYTRAGAEAASRAIYACQPYHLPPERYDEWRDITRMTFHPPEQ